LKGGLLVSPPKFHELWIEQCDAAQDIKLQYGPKAAFDYLVAEKLLYFAEAAVTRPDCARELPRFVARVRAMFTPQEIRIHLARIERERKEYAAAVAAHADDLAEEDFADEDEREGQEQLEEQDELDEERARHDDRALIRDSLAADAERARTFATLKRLLTATEIGTS
jgi:hypothetical protein